MSVLCSSSETQGPSVGSGKKVGRTFSSKGGRAPGYRLSPNYFQKFKQMPAPDWAQKMLCIIVPNRRTVPPVFVSSYTTAIREFKIRRLRTYLKTLVSPLSRPDWLPLGLRGCECCNADFWPVRIRVGLSWNFKVLQWINLTESFRHFYIHYECYVKRFKKKTRSSCFGDIQESAKSPNSEWSCT